jgi:hypothetical protein
MRTIPVFLMMASVMILTHACQKPVPSASKKFDPEQEKVIVDQVIHNAICWALTKDTATLFNTFVKDSTLFIFHPDSASTLTDFEILRSVAKNVWMTDRFKALECTIRDLRIHFSQGGDVAWYSCYLDDIGEWDGQKMGWRNVRWTGVLEKMEDSWLIMQMHFSFPEERFN